MERIKSGAQLISLMVAELLAIVALHRLAATMGIDWGNLGRWLDLTSIEDALAAVLRVVALILAYWLAASTVLYTLAVASRIPAAIRAVEWATLPAVQRLARRAAAATLVATVAAPGLAGVILPPPASLFETRATATETSAVAPDAPTVGVTDDGILLPPGIARPAYTPVPATEVAFDGAVPAAPTPPAAFQQDEEPTEAVSTPARIADQHEVVRGDNLWEIAASHLASVTGRSDLTDVEIAPYWAQVVSVNAGRLLSGNPDLIQPGEVIELPPFESA